MSDWIGTGTEASAGYLSAIKTKIRQLLKDESGVDFGNTEIDTHIGNCLTEISQRSPYKDKETLSTTEGSRELDISSITNLLGIPQCMGLEYPVGNYPRDYRNHRQIDAGTIEIDTNLTPGDAESVYLYCHKVHQLTELLSTLTPQLELVLIKGVVAYVALAWLNTIREQLEAAITAITGVNTTIGYMSARVTQAIDDLTTGRAKIGYKITEANTAIGDMSDRITAAIADITSGRDLVGSKKTEAIETLDAVAAEITQAGDDLTSGRAQIDDLRDTADGAIDDVTARITQALDDLTSSRAKIDVVPLWDDPAGAYANTASKELNAAIALLSQARAYQEEGSTSSMYQIYAARDLQKANTHIALARGYLAVDVVTDEYARLAASELGTANAYATQARMYLTMDIEAPQYANYASREIANAMGYLHQADISIKSLVQRVNIARATSSYHIWARESYANYKRDLKRLAEPKMYVRYPVS